MLRNSSFLSFNTNISVTEIKKSDMKLLVEHLSIQFYKVQFNIELLQLYALSKNLHEYKKEVYLHV